LDLRLAAAAGVCHYLIWRIGRELDVAAGRRALPQEDIFKWRARRDSNPRPSDSKLAAPLEITYLFIVVYQSVYHYFCPI
jgi:hypothetical protein